MSTENTAIVVGASRGLGRGIALTLAQAGLPVVAVARSGQALAELAATAGVAIEAADATDAVAAGALLERHRPATVVLVAGATPEIHPVHEHTWQTFSANWNTDVQMTFVWLREALTRPLAPGSRVIVISSGAALQGSPLSGGYAGSKATQRFMAAYAHDEARRAGLELTFTAVLPRITPLGGVGAPAIVAYAARNGQTEQEYLAQMGPLVTPQVAGDAVLELTRAPADSVARAYMLTGAGLKPLS